MKATVKKPTFKRNIVDAKHKEIKNSTTQKKKSEVMISPDDLQAALVEIQQTPEQELRSVAENIVHIQENINRNSEELIRMRFEQGVILRNIISTPKRYGNNAVKEIARMAGCSDKTLYEAHAFARILGYRSERLTEWMNEQRSLNKTLNMFLARKELIRSTKNPEAVGGDENHKDMLLSRAEEAIADVQAALDVHPDDVEVRGAAIMVNEGLAEYMYGDHGHGNTQQEDRFRCPIYLSWLHTQPCCVSGEMVNIDAHHLIDKSTGNQASDLFAVPLAHKLHMKYHDVLEHDAFEEQFGVNFAHIVQGLHQRFFLFVMNKFSEHHIKI